MAKPTPKQIKIANTAEFAMAMDVLSQKLGLKPATVAGAAMSIYVSKILDLAEKSGVELAHRNLDRAIEMLTRMRNAQTAKTMEADALALSLRHNEEAHAADALTRAKTTGEPS
jgi:hypothetical protein